MEEGPLAARPAGRGWAWSGAALEPGISFDADQLNEALAACSALFAAAVPSGWLRREGGLIAGACGYPVMQVNGVTALRNDADPATLSRLIAAMEASGEPFHVQLRQGAGEALRSVVAARGMEVVARTVLMAAVAARLRPAPVPEELAVRTAEPGEARAWASLMARAFGTPEWPWTELVTPGLLGAPGVAGYVGEVAGEAAAVAMGVTVAGHVVLCNIATLPEHRRRGYASVLTSVAVADGLAAGAPVAVLAASAEGRTVYGRLGFVEVEDASMYSPPAERR